MTEPLAPSLPLDMTPAYEAARKILDVPMDAGLIGHFTGGTDEHGHGMYAGTVHALVTDIVNAAAPQIIEQVREHLQQQAKGDLDDRIAEQATSHECEESGRCHLGAAMSSHSMTSARLRSLAGAFA